MYENISRYLYYALLAILIFNLTQRKYQQKVEQKRMASLLLAGAVLLFMAGGLVIAELNLGSFWFVAAGAGVALYLWLLREKIALFRPRCAECGHRYTARQIFYEDSPPCDCPPRRVEQVDWASWRPAEEAGPGLYRERGKGPAYSQENRPRQG